MWLDGAGCGPETNLWYTLELIWALLQVCSTCESFSSQFKGRAVHDLWGLRSSSRLEITPV